MGSETRAAPAVLDAIHLWVSSYGSKPIWQLIILNSYYGVIISSLHSVIAFMGFSVLNSIVGGQALASVGNVSWT